MCLTRWIDRIDDMSIFEELLVLIYHSRREIKENKYEARFNIKTLGKVDSISNILQTLLLLPHLLSL